MPRIDLMRFLLCSATTSLALLSIGRPAQAEGRCPPGYFPSSLLDGVGCSPVYGVPQSGGGNSTYTPIGSEYLELEAESRRERGAIIAEAFAALQLLEGYAAEQKTLINDPKYQAYLNGAWDFLHNENKAPGGSCAVLFSKLDGLILLTGPDKNYPGALLTFFGKDIPRPKQAERIKVALTQSNDPPQTVQAFNYLTPGIEYGAITFAVPTIEAALATIKDVTSFDLAIKDKSVLKIEWNGGLAARDSLRECESARIKK